MSKSKIIFLAAGIFLFLLFIYYFNVNNTSPFIYESDKSNVEYEKALVLKVKNNNLKKSINLKNIYFGSQDVTVKILTGKHKGDIKKVENYLSDIHNIFTKQGMTIIIDIDAINIQKYNASIYNYYRAPIQYIFLFIFFLTMCIIGGKKGLKSIFGIIFTFICILFLFIPMLYRGYSPLTSSFLIIFITTCVYLYILSGWSSKTLSAILGTLVGSALAATIGFIFGELAYLSGLNFNNAETLSLISTKSGMDAQGLLLASILISSLGAVMDLSMSIASSINEIYISNPNLQFRELFTSGMNIGKDMMGTMANTLIMAFTGSCLNVLIVIYSYNISFTQIINMDMTGIEIIQGVTGALSVILTVPICALISSKLIPCLNLKSNVI